MIGRIVFILVLLAVGYGLLKWWQRKRFIQKHTQNRVKRQQVIPSRMVRCQQCKLHVPEVEAIQLRGQFFCCQEHAHLGQTKS